MLEPGRSVPTRRSRAACRTFPKQAVEFGRVSTRGFLRVAVFRCSSARVTYSPSARPFQLPSVSPACPQRRELHCIHISRESMAKNLCIG